MNVPSTYTEVTVEVRRKMQARARRLAKRAENLATEGRVDEAIVCQSELVDLRPDDAGAVLRLGFLYREARRLEAAVTAFRLAARLSPNLCDPREALIETLLDAGLYDDVISEGRALLRVSPRNVFARDVLSVAYLQLGLLDKALHMATEMIRLDALNPGHHFKRALLLQQRGSIAEAVAEYMRAHDLANPHSNLAMDAREALESLDDMQIHQILLLASEDWDFNYQLRKDPSNALRIRGYTLSPDGLTRTQYIVMEEPPQVTAGLTARNSWGGVKFYN